MTRWEYQTIDVTDGDNCLDIAGAAGWEAYAVTVRDDYQDRHRTDRVLEFHLRRPLPNESEGER